jgi:asparagine synthase (glutamine-hydrolysing)
MGDRLPNKISLSALAAVCPWNGGAARARVTQLLAWQQSRFPSVESIWHETPAALGVTRRIAPDGRPDGRDDYAQIATACLVFDGFLDDRESIAGALGANACGQDDHAALALAAYARWGVAGFGRMSGDFALVLWDRRQRALVAARDLFGQRPLYYRADAGAIAIASEAQALVRWSPVAINEGMVAEYLASRTASASETLYQNIHRVPPGHALVARDGTLRVVSFATLDAPAVLSSSHPHEHAEEFRALLKRAVMDRLHPAGSLGVLLSGGMDSSSILATIREAERGAQPAPALACTLGFEGDAYDESPFAREVVARLGGPAIEMGPATDYDFAAEIADTLLPPTTPSAAVIAALRQAAADRGVRVMLTGVGADEWFGGTHWHYLDLLRRGRVVEAVRRRLAAGRSGQAVSLVSITRGFAWDATPAWMQRGVRRTLAPWLYPDWLDPRFVNRVDLAGRTRWRAAPDSGSLAQRGIWLDALSAVQIEQSEEQTRFAARFGQQDRQPFLDRRLVRFALALPEAERSGQGVTKIVERRAFGGVLPESVIRRTSFFDYSFYVADAVARFAAAGVFRQSRLAARGWIREQVLLSTIDRTLSAYRAQGRTQAASVAAVWPVLALELWYRGVEQHLSN